MPCNVYVALPARSATLPPPGHPDPLIPAVFVSQKAGIIMRKLMTLDVIRVRITPVGAPVRMQQAGVAPEGMRPCRAVLLAYTHTDTEWFRAPLLLLF